MSDTETIPVEDTEVVWLPARWEWFEIKYVIEDNREDPDVGWSAPYLAVDFRPATEDRQMPLLGGAEGETATVPGRPAMVVAILHAMDNPLWPAGSEPGLGLAGPSMFDVSPITLFRRCSPPNSFVGIWGAVN